MKPFINFILCCIVSTTLQAQTPVLSITTGKTTSLVFPFPVRHVDRGTKDVLVQPVKEAANILLVKAASENFPETNLSIVTGDGSLYSFLVTYSKEPSLLKYELPALSSTPLASYATVIRDNPSTVRGVRDQAWGMTVQLLGIYIKEGTLYYQLGFDNQSPIDYQVDYLRFLIKDRKQGKRTASQEVERSPLHLEGATQCIKAYSKEVVVVALKAFTLPDAKYFLLEVGEKDGGRHLALKVTNRRIVRAIPIPDQQ